MPANIVANNEKESTAGEPIYFSMNAPGWFTNIADAKEKCKIVEDIVNDLKNEKPITQKQREELINID